MASIIVGVVFTEDGIDQLARSAFQVNQQTESIGARRLHTVIEKVLEDISFNATEMSGLTNPIPKRHLTRERILSKVLGTSVTLHALR
jgi:ATP-dependent HslUV protease ATP-binding subunit HslU